MEKTCKNCKALKRFNEGCVCGLKHTIDTTLDRFGEKSYRPLEECEKPKTLWEYSAFIH